MMTLDEMRDWLPGATLMGDGSTRIERVHTDTRTLKPGDLFVALKGEHFDAHDFLAQARAAGASAAIAQSGLAQAELPGWLVQDTRAALGQLAAGWRARHVLPLIAVTGSNGKTTVTQMLACILRAWHGEAALATQGNLNNEIGVPLTLLRLRATHRSAVVELGMNHPGEIALLSAMARPTVALVNNAQREHQEFMASVEAVARENGSAIETLGPDAVAVFPADDVYTPLWRRMAAGRRVITFSLSAPADVTASAEWAGGRWQVGCATPQGSLAFGLSVAGRHNVKNALAAVACAVAAGAPLQAIAAGLESFEAVNGRSRCLTIMAGPRVLTLVDDTYNANPDSMRAAIDVLAELPGPHMLVLGDMGEVGEQGPEFHAEIGEYAADHGIETLLCMGEQMRYAAAVFPQARHHANIESLIDATRRQLPEHRSVLVKGSRFMRMERVVQALQAQPPAPRAERQEGQAHVA